MIARLVAARMDRWHDGPHGGGCPRPDGPQCSVYGAAAVRRYGTVAGVLAAAAYTASCSCFEQPDPDYPNPRRWDLLRVLALFVRIGLGVHTPPSEPHRPCSD